MSQAEFAVLDFIQAHLRCSILDSLMVSVSRLGDAGLIWIVIALGLSLFRRTRGTGLSMLLALALEVLLCNGLLKPLTARLRPCVASGAVELLILRPQDFSFPSGHTAAAFAALGALRFARAGWRLSAGLFAGLMAFSRLYLYVHDPTDVLAGAALGLCAGWAAAGVLSGAKKKL